MLLLEFFEFFVGLRHRGQLALQSFELFLELHDLVAILCLLAFEVQSVLMALIDLFEYALFELFILLDQQLLLLVVFTEQLEHILRGCLLSVSLTHPLI